MSSADDQLKVLAVGKRTVLGFGGQDILSQLNVSVYRDHLVSLIEEHDIETVAFDSFPNRESMASAGKKTLAGRKMSVDDIATVAAFLCSADAHMIRGQILVVDGGVTLSANF